MKALFLLCIVIAVVWSAALTIKGDTATASYLIQVEILAVLLQIKYNKEG